MKMLRASRWLAMLLVIPPLGFAQEARAQSAKEAAIRAAVAATEDRVVQLRYFGDAGETLGSVSPTLSGYSVGEGWVLTSLYALADDPAAILCQAPGAEPVEARVIGRDFNRGLALLRCGSVRADTPRIEGRRPRVGETVIAIGRVYEAGRVNVSAGVVSAVDRLGGRAVQTDAAISPANYGGPLVGLDGTLIGLITPISPPGQSGVGLYDSGVGFAVPASQIGPRLASLAAGEDLHAGWLGVGVSKEDPLRSPAILASVKEGSPAESAGFEEGDTITSLAGTPTPTAWAFSRRLSGLDAGQLVDAGLTRDGAPIGPIEARLAERPEAEATEPAGVAIGGFEPGEPQKKQPGRP